MFSIFMVLYMCVCVLKNFDLNLSVCFGELNLMGLAIDMVD